MPDEYRAAILKFVEMHANSELMGVLPERDWILRAPTLRRKLALTSKIQDEVGHAQLLYRVAEDLGKPREQMLADLLAGKTKFHNVFHYPTRSWGDVGIIAWLVDAAAIVSQQALRDSSYAPYARTMKKICWEESVHIMHGRDVVLTLMNGTDAPARDGPGGPGPMVGPAHADARPAHRPGHRQGPASGRSSPRATSSCARSSSRSTCRASGSWACTIPDPALRLRRGDRPLAVHRARLGRAPLRRHRPRSGVAVERLEFRRLHRAETQWVRDAVARSLAA